MTLQNFSPTTPPYQPAARAAIASGVFGILAIGSLIAYLFTRSPTPETGILMNRFHDAGVILQFLFMIPVAFGIQKISQQHSPIISKPTLFTGIAAICLVVLFLVLMFPKIVSDILYMVPQGVFGAWLIFINVRMKAAFSKALRWFGIITGLGLVLVGFFPLGFAIFVDSSSLQIPAAAPKDFPQTAANNILHLVLSIGSIMGVLTLPVWTIVLGRKFLRQKQHH